MHSPEKLPPAAWLTDAFTLAVFAALERAGGMARFAGGCVRDALLGIDVRDIDIATTLAPDAVVAALVDEDIRAVPTGIEHGTITAVGEPRSFEITTLREDVETDGRHAVVSFTEDWVVDSARRDFTINALYADLDGTIHDPQNGIPDLAERRVRFIGDPADRIHEDALRILRFYRFSAHYAHLPLDAAGHTACKAHRELLAGLSRERVTHELIRLLEAPAPLGVLQDMVIDRMLEGLLPEGLDLGLLGQVVEIERELGAIDAIRRLGSLVGADNRDWFVIADARKLSNSDRDRLVAMTEEGEGIAASADERAARRLLYRYGASLFQDRALLAWATSGDGRDHTAWEQLWHRGDDWVSPKFPLTGRDVMDLGISEGERVGELLARIEDWWIGEDFAPGRDDLLARLRELAAD